MSVIGPLFLLLMPALIFFGWLESHGEHKTAAKCMYVTGLVMLMIFLIFIVVLVSV